MPDETVTTIQLLGAGAFGLVLGWYVYYINRYRKGDVQLGDLVTLFGAIGGTAVIALFPARSDLFGAYGIGLAAGFFLYFIGLVIMVAISPNFSVDFFLDGRRRALATDEERPGDAGGIPMMRPMGARQGGAVPAGQLPPVKVPADVP